MSVLLIFSFVAIGLVGILTQFKGETRLSSLIHLLYYVASGLLIIDRSPGSFDIVLILFIILSLNLVISQIGPALLKGPFFRIIPALLSCFVVIWVFKDEVWSLNSESSTVINKFVVLGLVLTVLSYEIGSIKLKLFNKIFGGFSETTIMRSFMLFLVAVSFYLGFLGSSLFGIFLIAGIYLVTSFYRKEDTNYISVSFLNIIVAGILISNYELYTLSPDSGFGLFFGVFAIYFIDQIDSQKDKTYGSLLTALFVVILVGLCLWYAGNLFDPMGGVDGVGAVLIGMALANGVVGKNVLSIGVSSIFAGLLLFFSMTDSKELTVATDNVNSNDTVVLNEQIKYLSIEELYGNGFMIIPDSSSVSFELGKRKETKGAFKKVYGNFYFSSEKQDFTCEVVLKLDDFTTRNTMRDKELMGEDYFMKEKFPEMTFSSDSIVQIDELEYELIGNFTMLGITKAQKVSLRRLDRDSGVVLMVNGSIDRTAFGMSPNATEGNIVDFSSLVLLKREDQK